MNPRFSPDVRLFGLGLLLLFTCTARPGVTIYWLSGATNYSWAAALWLGFLCLYRGLAETENQAPSGWRRWAAVLVLGFLAGMTNENNIPGTWLLLGILFSSSAWSGGKNCRCGFMEDLRRTWRVRAAYCSPPESRPG